MKKTLMVGMVLFLSICLHSSETKPDLSLQILSFKKNVLEFRFSSNYAPFYEQDTPITLKSMDKNILTVMLSDGGQAGMGLSDTRSITVTTKAEFIAMIKEYSFSFVLDPQKIPLLAKKYQWIKGVLDEGLIHTEEEKSLNKPDDILYSKYPDVVVRKESNPDGKKIDALGEDERVKYLGKFSKENYAATIRSKKLTGPYVLIEKQSGIQGWVFKPLLGADLNFYIYKKETIGTIAIGDKFEKVINVLGKNYTKSKESVWGADGRTHYDIKYTGKGVAINIARAKGVHQVFSVSIQSPCAFQTKRGIKIGSADKEVMKAYMGYIDNSTTENILAGSVYGGINFELKNGRVTSISLCAFAE